jgi:uncharacterized membrane protein YqhA
MFRLVVRVAHPRSLVSWSTAARALHTPGRPATSGAPMFKHLLKMRYIAVVIVILAMLHSVAFLVMGARIGFKAYPHVLGIGTEPGPQGPGLELLHSLDFLFVSLVFMILALGIAKLFLLDPEASENVRLPGWLRIDSISELKVLLWETILTTLLIAGLSDLAISIFGAPDWNVLLTPLAILLLAVSLYFMRKGPSHH